MNKRFVLMSAAGATVAILSVSAFAGALSAQVKPIVRDTALTHAPAMAMPRANGMAAMTAGPHHALAAAYRDNLAIFARALNTDVNRTHAVNADLARPATVEMRRSFDQMKQHHQAQMSSMGTQMTMPMPRDSAASGMMRNMESHVAALGMHLTALEAEVQGSAPSAAKVTEHTAEILKQCEGMMPMPANTGVKGGGSGSH
jgi:hypothetical protein